MEQIDNNILVETGNLGSNNSIILTSIGIVLIDSPFKPTDAIKWKHAVESKGKVICFVNTDHHIDHTMGNFFLPANNVISH